MSKETRQFLKNEFSSPIRDQLLNLADTVGKAGAHALFPNEFEYYLIALELVNSNGKMVDFLVFPVMPSSISIQHQPITNIKKTVAGVTISKTLGFVPYTVRLSGNFGKKFKFLLGRFLVSSSAVLFGEKGGRILSNQIKTGYGCIKVLENMLINSNKLNIAGRPFRLNFYNLAFGQSSTVEPINFQFKQSLDSNMMWEYDIEFKVVGPLIMNKLGARRRMAMFLAFAAMSKAADGLSSAVASTLKKVYKNKTQQKQVNNKIEKK